MIIEKKIYYKTISISINELIADDQKKIYLKTNIDLSNISNYDYVKVKDLFIDALIEDLDFQDYNYLKGSTAIISCPLFFSQLNVCPNNKNLSSTQFKFSNYNNVSGSVPLNVEITTGLQTIKSLIILTMTLEFGQRV